MRSGDFTVAADFASVHAAIRWGSPWYPPRRKAAPAFEQLPAPAPSLTIPKLEHDVEQFVYLQERGVLGSEFTEIIREYERVVERLSAIGTGARELLTGDEWTRIGHVYNRIVHLRRSPRMQRALSKSWRGADVEEEYLAKPPGIVVVDDFLTPAALEEVRRFCLESTIWSTNRYSHGRLGSFFHDGFNSPLLLQIADDLRTALPRVIGDRHRLRQVWGFKYGCTLPGRSTHADFAAVNVNFWVTPDDANLDDISGGLVVYDAVAPLDWDFETYNRRGDLIEKHLQEVHARAIHVPYRQNRAIIFNSDLFHATAPMLFRSGYENRRLNVTMLYGDRREAAHRRGPELQS